MNRYRYKKPKKKQGEKEFNNALRRVTQKQERKDDKKDN